MKIKKITEDKDRFMNLLLLGDEQESMIYRYLERGELFALYDTDLKTVCAVTQEDEKTFEIKNIATYQKEQGKGYGSLMMKYIIDNYKDKCDILLVGTGDDPTILSFYKKFGFVYSHTVKNFFIDNYDHEIFDNGKQLIDMVYLKNEIKKS